MTGSESQAQGNAKACTTRTKRGRAVWLVKRRNAKAKTTTFLRMKVRMRMIALLVARIQKRWEAPVKARDVRARKRVARPTLGLIGI